MSNVKRWAYINKTFKNHSRSAVIWKYVKSDKKEYREYRYYLAFFLGVSIVAVFFSYQYFYITSAIMFVASFISYLLVEKKLSKDLNSLYEQHDLGDYPLSERARQLSYLLFKEQLDKDSKIKAEDITVLLKWNDINNEKVDRMIFFKSKYMLMIVTALLALTIQHLQGQALSTDVLLAIFYTALLLLILSFFVFDFSSFPKDRNLQITRFLKWYEIENNS